MTEFDPSSLGLLLVEDSTVDAELVCDALQQAGYRIDCRRVEDEDAFRAALGDYLPDAILSDWTLPRFSGRTALVISRERCPEVPFLFVTGTMDESFAIEALRQGASDYVYKHKLALLGPALARALAGASERRQHLRAEAERYRLSEALRQTLQPVILADIEGRITYVNPALTRLLGYGVEDLRGESMTRLCPPDTASQAQQTEILRQVRETGLWSGEVLRCAKDGTHIPVLSSIGALRDTDGTQTGFVGNSIDLRPLRESEEQLRAVSDAAQDGIILMDGRGNILSWNAAAERMFGYRSEEVIGRDLHRHIAPDRYHADFRAAFPHFQATGQGRFIGITRELSALHKDGHEFPVEVAFSAVQLRGSWHGVGIVRDITERKQAEKQQSHLEKLLHQAQKMDAIGQLTGGIAHDFNNLLGVLIGNLDLVRERILDDQDGLELVDAALDAALRGAELNKRMLAFARRQSLQPELVNVGDTLDDIAKLLKRSLGERVEIQHGHDAVCWPFKVDPSQFQSTIVNLGVNARDAMPNGGLLIIECRNVSADDAFAESHIGMRPGDYVAISVSDTGCGMTPEVLAHVFEPFYTTKAVGKVTGLGLSMVHGFANQSGGHVSIYSEPGKGTTIRLYLPRCLDDASTGKGGGSEKDVPPLVEPGRLLVLVVDDNPDILKITIRQLQDLGYRTQDARNADEALALVGQGVTPDILFTDIIMPGSMDGLELADRLRAALPALSVLLCSGFTERAAIDAHQREGRPIAFPLLAKPFRKDDLARALSALREKPELGALRS